ncbi:DUF5131 family protein [Micromonospora sp. NPDC048935]|uniref:DUF5131 family protein n=1 Tax=Micromonospora sp. NPDC048935 TaxID=3364262 RepID=UPI003720EE7B
MADTAIEWADKTWNPLLGCERVSAGCDGCYAISTATIRAGNPHPKVAAAFAGLTERRDGRLDWTGRINLLPERLTQPLHWRKPQRIFVNSQSDLFHRDVPDSFIAQVFAVMALAEQHTFQLLTKRHGRMRSLLNSPAFRVLVLDQAYLLVVGEVPSAQAPQHVVSAYHRRRQAALLGQTDSALPAWPLTNVHLGVSVEDQKTADLRIPALLATPAAVRWLSCEPLLGSVDLTKFLHWRPIGENLRHSPLPPSYADACGLPALHWCVVGGESGPKSRLMSPEWARNLRDQCISAQVPFFFKQTGSVLAKELGIPGKGDEWNDLPTEFQIRDMPQEVAHV